tara:strand:+ start:13439 stop:13882 length:444 start_codon:yes stop_codon:yes gene_type:complete
MAITTITDLKADIRTASIGNFNTFHFGYLGEINSYRASSSYPLLMLLPPESNIADVYKGDETYTLVFHCYTFNAEALDNSQDGLVQTYDQLMDFFSSFMNTLLRNNESKYVLGGSMNIERVSREFNDNLVGLVITIPLKSYTKCFNY